MSSPLNLTNLKPNESGIPSKQISSRNYRVLGNAAVRSIFSLGVGQFSPFPAAINPGEGGRVTAMNAAKDVHADEIYDTSITSIVEHCNKTAPSMKLDYADFAYLKNVGVYPNNRLIIARRFSGGVANDLTLVTTPPLSTLISWVGEEEDFISIKYNEDWIQSEADFESVLNDIGADVKASQDIKSPDLGNLVGRAFDILPLPGFMEGLQNNILKRMGLTDSDIGNSPYGNPNIIAESMRRKTVDFKNGDTGLSGKFSIKMVVEYEQKFINGVDPTLVYMDIIQNALTFGTSDSAFKYGSAFGTGVTGLIANLISGDFNAIWSALNGFVQALLGAIGGLIDSFVMILIEPEKKEEKPKNDSETENATEVNPDAENIKLREKITRFLKSAFSATVGSVISKYKIRLIGIANALTGSPSTPWHITIGNPKKPIFSSGDMLCTDVTLTMGKVLAFNDLPSSIKLELNFISARNLGAQEIFNRFNTGRGRSYVRLNRSFVESPEQDFVTGSDITKFVVTPSKDELATKPKPINDPYVLKWENLSQLTNWLEYGTPQSNVVSTDNTDPILSNSNNIINTGTSQSGIDGVNVQTDGNAASPDGVARTNTTEPKFPEYEIKINRVEDDKVYWSRIDETGIEPNEEIFHGTEDGFRSAKSKVYPPRD